MKFFLIALIAAAAIGSAALLYWNQGPVPVYASDDHEGLAPHMDYLRRVTHKLGLSIDARNKDLAEFYAGEIGESVSFFQEEYPEYDGYPVGALSQELLTPRLAPVTKAIAAGDWAAASSSYDTLMSDGCNACHAATQHAFIKIERNKSNPFNQTFTP